MYCPSVYLTPIDSQVLSISLLVVREVSDVLPFSVSHTY